MDRNEKSSSISWKLHQECHTWIFTTFFIANWIQGKFFSIMNWTQKSQIYGYLIKPQNSSRFSKHSMNMDDKIPYYIAPEALLWKFAFANSKALGKKKLLFQIHIRKLETKHYIIVKASKKLNLYKIINLKKFQSPALHFLGWKRLIYLNQL